MLQNFVFPFQGCGGFLRLLPLVCQIRGQEIGAVRSGKRHFVRDLLNLGVQCAKLLDLREKVPFRTGLLDNRLGGFLCGILQRIALAAALIGSDHAGSSFRHTGINLILIYLAVLLLHLAVLHGVERLSLLQPCDQLLVRHTVDVNLTVLFAVVHLQLQNTRALDRLLRLAWRRFVCRGLGALAFLVRFLARGGGRIVLGAGLGGLLCGGFLCGLVSLLSFLAPGVRVREKVIAILPAAGDDGVLLLSDTGGHQLLVLHIGLLSPMVREVRFVFTKPTPVSVRNRSRHLHG